MSDCRVCYNCHHFDENSYNQCLENQAERVVEKDKRNFCDFFRIRDSSVPATAQTNTKENVFRELDNLFKR
jgi:hypothetical protein